MKQILSSFLCFVCLVFTVSSFSDSVERGPKTHPKISSWLLEQYYQSRKTQRDNPTLLIFLKEEASLAKISDKWSRPKRLEMTFKNLVSTARKSQGSLLNWLQSENLNSRSYYINNMVAVDGVSLEQLFQIAQREDVLKVVGNPSLRNTLPFSNRNSSEEEKGPGVNLVRFGASKVWSELKITGEKIIVGGQDTGVKWNHKALKEHYRGWDGKNSDHRYSWYDAVHKSAGGNSSCGYDLKTPCDDHGHGTHTIGTVVGDDGQGNQIGVAPGAKWVACRNMDDGIGTPEMYIECFQWFLAPWPQGGDPIEDARPDLAPHVINNSWGCPKSEGCEGGEFERILTALRAAGVFVVASAGNDGSRCDTIMSGPAFHSDLVLSVGAMNHRNDSIASFSSRGPSTYDKKLGPHVTAPGVNIRSSVPSGGYSETGWSGTSMAGPHLVGLVALLWAADPSLVGNIEKTENLIKETAEPKTSSQTCGGVSGESVPNNTFGFGIANAYKAVKSVMP